MKKNNEVDFIIEELERMYNPRNVEGMQRFGIRFKKAFGIPMPYLRKLSKTIGKNHELGLRLWDTGIHEAQLLAIFISEPGKLTKKQMETWLKDFQSWDICDQACGNLFEKTPWAYDKIIQWSKRKHEFQKRAAFSMIATLAVHDKKAADRVFISLLPVIEKAADDDRNFVKKSVNWALRNIGKRNAYLRDKAMATAQRILKQDTPSARWIARDALRELKQKTFKK